MPSLSPTQFSSLDTLAAARVWLFDFDNTLAALEPEVDWAASRIELERYLRAAGIDEALFREISKGNLLLYDALRCRLTHSREAQHACSQSQANAEMLLDGASRVIEAYELRGCVRAQPLPGAVDLLRFVKAQDRTLAIVTSNSSRTVASWLGRHAATPLVDFVVGRDTLLPLKPAPEMIARALALTRAEASETVLVGDSAADAGAARTAGVPFYGVANTPAQRDRLAGDGARAVFASPAELAKRLAAITL